MGFIERTYGRTVDFLDGIGETQFGLIATDLAGTGQLIAVLVALLVLINMTMQWQPIDGRASLVLFVKLILVAVFMQNWAQFNSLVTGLYSLFDSVAASFLRLNGTVGEANFARSLDDLIEEQATAFNMTSSRLNILGSVMNAVMLLLIAIFGAFSTLAMVGARVVLTLLISLGPLAIMASLSDKTKSYFDAWVSAITSMLIFPVLIAGIFATILAMGRETIASLNGTINSVGDVAPLMMVVVLSILLVAASPFLLTQITGSFQLGGYVAGLARGSTAPARQTAKALGGAYQAARGNQVGPGLAAKAGGAVGTGVRKVGQDTKGFFAGGSGIQNAGIEINRRAEQLSRGIQRAQRFRRR